MKTLLLVDLQNDFIPGGSFPIKEGDKIIPLINQLVHAPFDLIVATKDWHPPDHGSFADNHNKKPGDHINLKGIDQILWPRHCVQGTPGADFAPGWASHRVDKVIYKGTDSTVDSYSTFFDNARQRSTGLENFLKEKGAHKLYIAGLATDYCVKYSVLDAIQLGFEPWVIVDACKGINVNANDTKHAFETMQAAGAQFTSFNDVIKDVRTQ